MRGLRREARAAIIGLCLAGAGVARGDYTTFLDNGPSGNRVDLVFLGDGYQASEMGTYQTHINAMMSHMFGGTQDPFPRYQKYFNGHRANVISNQSGADDPGTGTFIDTALDATYYYDGVTERLLYINPAKGNNALNTHLSGASFTAEMRLVTVNASKYGGGGGYNSFAVYAGGNGAAPEIALHELGHSFSVLADEYQYFNGSTYVSGEPFERNVTKDSTGSKWAHWIGYDQPGIGVIGAYEGARYNDFGIYRPSQDSKMRSLDRPFDAVSREAFILDIYGLVDPLDGWTDNTLPLIDPGALGVDEIDSDIIETEWYVNGVLVAGAMGETFDPRAYGYGPGVYQIRAHSFDPTDWVRISRDQLEQDVSWTVTYTAVPEPSSVIALLSGGLVLLRRRKRSG